MAKAEKKNDSGANLGFEAKLWLAADKMRNNMDAAKYKHVVLGLIFLKYISDAFEEHQQKMGTGTADPDSEWYVKDAKQRDAVLEDRDEYLAVNVFWVPKEARWSYLLANGSMSSSQSGEGEIRKAMIEADLVDCMVALPGQLFYSMQIPVCLWFLARNNRDKRFRSRPGETLFIDARKLGVLIDRVHRELTDEEIARVAGTYHAWRGDKGADKSGARRGSPDPAATSNRRSPAKKGDLRSDEVARSETGHSAYKDVPGFCKSAKTAEIAEHGFVLTPGRYVGAAELEEADEPFDEKMQRLMNTLAGQFKDGAKLEKAILKNLASLGFSPKEPT